MNSAGASRATKRGIVRMNAEIVCVGTELLLGDIVNTNAAFLAQELAAAGISVFHQSVVGDNPQRLLEAFQIGLSRADVVLTTGGLGPTYDDLTKETAAKYFNRKMVLDESLLENIRCIFSRIGREMTHNNDKQAVMPEGAHVFPNENGTAPGLALEQDGKIIVMMPGPPREMKPMFLNQVLPYLTRGEPHTLVSRTIHVFGMGESAVEELLRDRMNAGKNPTIAPYAKEGEVQLRVTAFASAKEEAERMLDPVVAEICGLLGDVVYGVDAKSLQNALVTELTAKGLTVAAAESCSGGLVSERITEIPGSSAVFGLGVCTYANSAKEQVLGVPKELLEKHGAVSPAVAESMAACVRRVSHADIGISVTGIAGPGGGSDEKPVGLVYVAVCSDAYSDVIKLNLGRGYAEQRAMIRYVASSHALASGLKAARLSPART